MPSTAPPLIRSMFTLGAAQMLSWVGAALLVVLFPRYLGDVNFGKLTLAIAVTQLAGLLTDLGTATFLTKEIAREPGRATTHTSSALAMRLPFGIVAGVIVIASVNLLGYDPLTRDLATI